MTYMGPSFTNVTPKLSMTEVQTEAQGRAGMVQIGGQSKQGRTHFTQGSCSHSGSHGGLLSSGASGRI